MVEELRTASNKVSLEINLSKTKVMFNRNVEIQPIMTGNVALDQVDRYTYLGQLISIHRDWEPEVRRRVALDKSFKIKSVMMKGYIFRDQVNDISSCFEQWNHCEQLVFLYALVQKLTETQCKFIKMVLEKSLKHASHQAEIEANDPAFLSELCGKPKDHVVEVLLSHLPLLHADNESAKIQYMLLIPKILQDSLINMLHIEESKRLLSYAVIHPAISSNERRSLASWMQTMEEAIKNNQNIQLSSSTQENSSSNMFGYLFYFSNLSVTNEVNSLLCFLFSTVYCQEGWPKSSQNNDGNYSELQVAYSSLQGLGSRSLPAGLGTQLSHAVYQFSDGSDNNNRPDSADQNECSEGESSRGQRPYLRRRSKSYSPVISSVIASQIQTTDQPNYVATNDENMVSHQKNVDFETAPLSPQESITSSGSETNEESRSVNDSNGSGMKEVGTWLKSLRLHKYSHLFENITYDEMMNLTEEQLEKQNVTKGARHKIVISIQKLRDRPEQLRSIKQKILVGANLRESLTELKLILQTPIKPFSAIGRCSESHKQESPCHSPTLDNEISEDDLPSLFTLTIVETCNQLSVINPDDESCTILINIIDKCMTNEAFQPLQRRRLYALKQQLLKYRFPAAQYRTIENCKLNRNSLPHPSTNAVHNRRRHPVAQSQHTSVPLINKSVPLTTGQSHPTPLIVTHTNQQPNSCGVKQSASLNEHTKPSTLNIQRRNSAPVRTNQLSTVTSSNYRPVQEVVDPEIDTRLRSLCLRMTEHALAGSAKDWCKIL
ncbi:Protein Smaug 1 [Nymphon striatum]|nr:Protein Smaug 1 [Nymphon striatum]